MKLPDPPLLLVTDRHQARLPLPEVVTATLVAGCRWISLREKDLSPLEQIALIRELRPFARQYGACLTLHGDPALACAAGCDGVHLSSGSDVTRARALLGRDALIGLSVHAVDPLALLERIAADYLLAGPTHVTASKPDYGPALGPDGLTTIVRATNLPVLAIGGITADNLAPLFAAGAGGIAVMGGIMRADDPGGEMRSTLQAVAIARLAR